MQGVAWVDENKFPVTWLLADSSRGEVSSQLNGLFNIDIMNRMLEGKDCRNTDMVFQFIISCLDKATDYTEDRGLTEVSKTFLV